MTETSLGKEGIDLAMARVDAFIHSIADVARRRGKTGNATVALLRVLEQEVRDATGARIVLPDLGSEPSLDDLLVRAEVLLASLNTDRYQEWKTRREVLSTPVRDLEVSSRCRRGLASLGVRTVGDLLTYTADELRRTKNFGDTSFQELTQALRALGFSLRDEMAG